MLHTDDYQPTVGEEKHQNFTVIILPEIIPKKQNNMMDIRCKTSLRTGEIRKKKGSVENKQRKKQGDFHSVNGINFRFDRDASDSALRYILHVHDRKQCPRNRLE